MILDSISDFLNKDIENKLLFKNDYLFPSILISYILFVTWIGPSLMITRKPFKLRGIMVVYNFIEVCVNIYVFKWIFSTTIFYWHARCLLFEDPEYLAIYKKTLPLWWFVLLNKMFELWDTVFIVLRKKWNQLSGLHIIHHSIVCSMAWWFTRNPSRTGFYFFVVLGINIVVHTVLYTYYGLSSIGPHMEKYLWWKKYLTALQIGQFVVDIAYVSFEVLTGCKTVGISEIITFAFITYLLILFLNLYKEKYCK
ncbi:unnamed protein product [Larinioides sclopetarius]|uniref:Elongation of very long chain fatty acids protein n=1 Tax=Larinioides sclopetarius TaxID=280406 RepID=A0AAV2BEN4_9ARAC